jgi:hypothetical protein
MSWGESTAVVESIEIPAGSTGDSIASEQTMRAIRIISIIAALACGAVPASAVTLDQVLSLKKAGVTDAVVLALIERDHTVFTIQPEQVVELQRLGLSEALIIAMLKSGQAGDEAVRAESAYTSAMIAAAIAPAPELVIVGHGPERPNTYHADGFFSNANSGPLFVPPYRYGAVPYGFQPPYASFDGRGYTTRRSERYGPPRALCYAQVTTSASAGSALTYVTECPAVMQPRRVR